MCLLGYGETSTVMPIVPMANPDSPVVTSPANGSQTVVSTVYSPLKFVLHPVINISFLILTCLKVNPQGKVLKSNEIRLQFLVRI